MKNNRQEEILRIISENDIKTQESLQDILNKLGYDVTQATISRDIRELKLVKKSAEGGGYKYSKPMRAKQLLEVDDSIFTGLFSDAVINIDCALNTVCIKCHTGMAQAVCARLDNKKIASVVGTLAGDDTIFILMRCESSAKQLVQELKEMKETK